MNKFFKGLLLLILAAFAGECIEFLINMVLARQLGEHGLGLYMSILPTIFLIVLLASFEMPVSISKFIAEKDRKYHYSMLNHVIRMTVIFSLILIPLASAILPFITVFDDYHPLLRWMAIILIPIISFSSIARGYFMGNEQMGKIASANFLRKFIQLSLLVLLFHLFRFETETAVFIAVCTFVGSEIAIFAYFIHLFVIQYQRMKKLPFEPMSGMSVWKNLMGVSIPTTGLRIFHALTHAIQPFLIKAALLKSGISTDIATEHFGMVAGVAMTIGMFPAFIAHSFMVMLIPTVSRAYAEEKHNYLRRLLQQVFFITFLYGVPSVTIFYFFAEPLTSTFFHSIEASIYVQLLWPFFLLHFFIFPMQAFLIGLGLMKDAFYHAVWSTLISFVAMYVFGSMESLQMHGVILGINMGAILLMFMHYMTICKKIGVTWFLTKQTSFS
ncbi:oligosaccharide flippase family protein [Cytobacillus sp. FSL W7-1323]|uniref:Multidrug transporter MatE n=1 Tax=Cytobacillus kochii TaxID=859143 RepID=A0A248TEE1_9BACI|nr:MULTISPECIES: oligosaccharide flippase family protein [Cytobacillus]ASV66533.1 multidrug transporter MatE [Cytobacillus kochii]MDQ0186763.1 O-antigen/teichoic acid export membrane protein [Cytobacillus kochii]MEA1854332.1 oligosaccharide flippase family protein [Cytobacillus sp. OWB-43]MED1607046.1 oligosaccharide flippase family protein [Cytobacillus kochii]